MLEPRPADSALLGTLLKPLLDDFQYWFERADGLLRSEAAQSLDGLTKAALLERLNVARAEVNTARSLLQLTHGEVGVEMAVLMGWHQLVTECWQVSAQFRS